MVTQTRQITIKLSEEEFKRLEDLHFEYIESSKNVVNRTEFIKMKLGVKNEECKDVR
jgi:RNase P subunit RPR2